MSGMPDKPLMIVYRTACKPYKAAWTGNAAGAPVLWFTASSPGGITLTKRESCGDTAAPPTPSPNGPRKIAVAATTTATGTWAASYRFDGAGCLLRPMDPEQCGPNWFSKAGNPSGWKTTLTAKASVILPDGASPDTLDRPNLRCTALGMQPPELMYSMPEDSAAGAVISVSASGPPGPDTGALDTISVTAESKVALWLQPVPVWTPGSNTPPHDWPPGFDGSNGEVGDAPPDATRWLFTPEDRSIVKEVSVTRTTPWWITEITVSVSAYGLEIERFKEGGGYEDDPQTIKARFEFSAELLPV